MAGRIITFSSAVENDGSLTFLEGENDIPFSIKRVFYIYGVPEGGVRANHACVNSEFVLIAINGSVNVTLNDGASEVVFELNAKKIALYIPKLTWMKTSNFSSDAILLILASENYKESQYVADFEEFKKMIKNKG